MKVVKLVLLAGITGTLTSISVFAVPLNITFTGNGVVHDWGGGYTMYVGNPDVATLQFADLADFNGPPAINLAGVNSINVTWAAPAGYMYVVNPPPADIGSLGLEFEVAYGAGGQASSLGSVTALNISANTVYGKPSFQGGENLPPPFYDPQVPGLIVEAFARDESGTTPFAFTSVTLSLDFSKTGRNITLEANDNEPPLDDSTGLFGLLVYPGSTYNGPPDPGQLLTLEPLQTASTPDDSPTFGLAGLGFAGLLLLGRRLLPANG